MEAVFQTFLLLLLLLIAIQPKSQAMQITSTGPQTIQKAQGESVTLGCTYSSGAQDTGDLDIEWSALSPDMTQKDKLLLSYTGGQILRYSDGSLSSRLNFSTSPNQGDASVTVADAKASDTATYQCKVKKAPGVDSRKVTLLVLVPPSAPRCSVDGAEEKGSAVSLMCKSRWGSNPLSYTWTRQTGGAMPATATQNSQTGALVINNLTDSNVGTYMCEASNAVGKAQCTYELHAYNPVNKVGVIVGAVIGALLLLLLLLFLIWLLWVCCCKRRYEKEAANELKEDAPAPESRPASRNSSMRSVVGYRAHPGVHYSGVVNHLPSIRETGRSSINSGRNTALSQPSTTDVKPLLHYDHQYGYAV
ncbi:V-set and immunoglobulin domain-containing protein 8b [Betta splendens]|uniref:V-set and immunoglobulin domain-containing protein 8b n=1 Tax=Betta splendens TaxID=158456 RepID=UPI0010F4F3DB|nr:V-set and immunoglobulin domain-containing protein 8b [Betta splendens]